MLDSTRVDHPGTLLRFSRAVMRPPFTWSFEIFVRLAPKGSDVDIIRISDDYTIKKSNMGGWNHVWTGQIGKECSAICFRWLR
jgi:hypothetical protein